MCDLKYSTFWSQALYHYSYKPDHTNILSITFAKNGRYIQVKRAFSSSKLKIKVSH